jgi:hypothetical protein
MESLDEMQILAVRVSKCVQPGEIVETDRVAYERIFVPTACGICYSFGIASMYRSCSIQCCRLQGEKSMICHLVSRSYSACVPIQTHVTVSAVNAESAIVFPDADAEPIRAPLQSGELERWMMRVPTL